MSEQQAPPSQAEGVDGSTTELEQYKAALLKARVAVYRLLVTHGPRMQGNWYNDTAQDAGLEIDPVGHLQQADDKLR